jgi:hypothetical protein
MIRHGYLVDAQAWKTGQRVAVPGAYVDQYGVVSHHTAHATFPPCIGRKGECAYRYRVLSVASAA